jgi:hypothetical protein
MDAFGDPLGDSQRGVASPHSRRLVSDLDDSRLLDKQASNRAFAEKPEL